MSVATFKPEPTRISMTPAAVAHTRTQLSKAGAAGLRLGVKKSGCSGFMYVLDLVAEAASDDQEFVVDEGVSVFVDSASLPYVGGTEIDYVREGLSSFYKFNNPNAQSACGCGESFSVS